MMKRASWGLKVLLTLLLAVPLFISPPPVFADPAATESHDSQPEEGQTEVPSGNAEDEQSINNTEDSADESSQEQVNTLEENSQEETSSEEDDSTEANDEIVLMSGGSGTAGDPFIIETIDELLALATAVNNGANQAGVYYALGDHIDASLTNWPSIGYYGVGGQRPFAGSFDGNGYTITGLHASGKASTGNGLFGYLAGSASNIDISLSGTFAGTSFYTGIIAGYAANAQIMDCTVRGAGQTLQGTQYVGGIAGYAVNATISGCEVLGEAFTLTAGIGQCGGIAGHVESNVTIEGCSVSGINNSGGTEIAGIAGRLAPAGKNLVSNCMVADSSFTATGVTLGYAAGLIGIIEGSNAANYSTVSGCSTSNVTTYTTAGNYSAGLIGAARFAQVSDCQVFSSTITAGTSYAGGVFGVIYNGTQVTGCSVEDTVVTARHFSGGFVADTYTDTPAQPSTITDSYAAGGRAVCGATTQGAAQYGVGGFTAVLRATSSISNCYAQVDVINNSTTNYTGAFGGSGGFVANMHESSTIANCYATGTVNAGSNPNAGSFIGRKYSTGAGTITNCYATGTMIGTSASVGGFAGAVGASNRLIDCFFDTTTTRRTIAVGSGNTAQSVTGLTTESMIQLASFASWGAQENLFGAAGSSGNDNAPWYIDDGFTYPYLYYQYDGHSAADTNYFLAGTLYADGTGLGQKRADFTVNTNSLPLQVRSSGAVRAYFPYSGTSRFDITEAGFTSIPGASYSATSPLLHSLGGISRTNIISFGGVPVAEKTSDRTPWDYTDPATFTYVGDTVTYTIVIHNYSDDADFTEVLVSDILDEGLTLLPGSITLNSGDTFNPGDYIILTDDDSSGAPYYSFDNTSRELTLFLEDMPKINAESGVISAYTITFKVFLEKESASEFIDPSTSPPVFEGDIKNDAMLSGDLWYTNATDPEPYEDAFSDGNTDPIYDVCIFAFTKLISDEDTPLEGAVFSAYYWTGTGAPPDGTLVTADNITSDPAVPDRWYLCATEQSNSNGLVSMQLGIFPTSYPGYYQLVETLAPMGFSVPSGQWLLEVNSIAYVASIATVQSSEPDAVAAPDFNTTTTEIVRDLQTYTVIDSASLINTPPDEFGSVTVLKVGSDGTSLEGASFALQALINGTWYYLYYSEATGVWVEETTNSYTQETAVFPEGPNEGEAGTIFENLPLGTYRLLEVAAPAGHQTLPSPIEFTIPYESDGSIYYDLTFTVEDSAEVLLPTSGGALTAELMMLIGLVIILLSATAYVTRTVVRKRAGMENKRLSPD